MARSVDVQFSLHRSTRNRKSSESLAQPSGSEYSAGDASLDVSSPADDRPATRKKRKGKIEYEYEEDFSQKVDIEFTEFTTSHGRQTKRPSNYVESEDDDVNNLFDQDEDQMDVVKRPTRSSTRSNGARGGHARVNEEGEVSIADPARMTRRKCPTRRPPTSGAMLTMQTYQPPDVSLARDRGSHGKERP